MNEPSVILLCGSRFGLQVLKDLVFHKHLAAVVIPYLCADFGEEVQQLLKDADVPVLFVNNENYTATLQMVIEKYNVTLGLMISFSYKIPAAVYQMPVCGFFNIHPGPLPAYRGPDPVFHQIKNREKYAGVTIHTVDDHFDTGQVVLAEMIYLQVSDTHGILTTRLAEVAARLTSTLIKLIGFNADLHSRPQNEAKATYYKKQRSADVIINWEVMDAAAIVALINACNPWNKGAIAKINGKIIKLTNAYLTTIISTPSYPPGTILSIDEKGMIVSSTGEDAVCVQTIYMEEGFLMADRLKNFSILPGCRFEVI